MQGCTCLVIPRPPLDEDYDDRFSLARHMLFLVGCGSYAVGHGSLNESSMAANKFATKLHRSTNKIVVVLVYAVLEWILITLLLFNSLFYYFIKKFASFFGLKPTCLWCSSVDCLFEPGRKDGSFEGLVCEAHASQISKKAVEIRYRCRECLQGVDNASEDGLEDELSCSCCGKRLKSDLPPLLMINDSLDVVPKESSSIEEIEEEDQDNSGSHGECCNVSNEEPHILSDVGSFYLQEAVEEDSSRSTSNSLCNDNEGNEDEEDTRSAEVDARIQLFALKVESTEAISSSADLPSADNKFHDESEDMESNCVIIGDDSGSLVAVEEEEKENKYVELEKEEVGGKETSVSCESDLKSKDLTTQYEEEIFIDNETSANEASDDHPDEKHNEESLPILEHGKEESQSHFNIEEGNVDNGFDRSLPIDRLRSELESERKARKDLSTELEAERSAAATAANQTMAMITRLQEEKAAIKMEAVQYQRMMEEQAEYDQEALQLLNELVIKREKEKQELEEELEAYREKVLDYEVFKEKAMSLRKGGCSSSSCSLNEDSEKLSIDLNREIGEDREHESEEMPSTGAVLDTVDMVLDRVKNWNMLDGSLEEFEQERVSILHQLKELEEKLFSICDDDQQEDQLLFEAQETELKDENANLCSAEVNLAPGDHPTTMASAAKKLLPLLEKEEANAEQVALDVIKIEPAQKATDQDTNDRVLAVMKEMDHVYGRLQALEADREFLRHCIGSLDKGDKGVVLLEEILQHLRELRNADTCELMICHH